MAVTVKSPAAIEMAANKLHPATPEVYRQGGGALLALPAAMTNALAACSVNLPARVEAARARMELSAIEKHWIVDEEVYALVIGVEAGAKDGGANGVWARVTFVRLDPDTLQPTTNPPMPETRIAPTILENEVRRNLGAGHRVYLMCYKGKGETSSGGGKSPAHKFGCEPLDGDEPDAVDTSTGEVIEKGKGKAK